MSIVVYVVCDAGMGSSALSASLLRKAFKQSSLTVEISNVSIDQPMDSADVLITHKHFEPILKKNYPMKIMFSLDDFLDQNRLRKVVEAMEKMYVDAVLTKENIRIVEESRSSEEAIRAVGQRLYESGYVEEAYIQGMLERDQSLSVYIGNYIALPHGEYEYKKNILKSGIVIDVYPQGIDWHGETAKLVIGLAGIGEDHMAILSNIATVFEEADDVNRIVNERNVEQIFTLLTQEDVL
jgi:mannitol/fructose-specific phosphotransferase system IIA component/galactitol-specific phosphotransferase system IIB component